MKKTCEFVTPKHPDKICDLIADSILDAYLALDKNSRVAIEVMGGHGEINVSGEVTSSANVDIKKIVDDITGTEYKLNIKIEKQSLFIAQGVDIGGAGDQGIMVGYACAETETLMPQEYELARDLCQKIYEKYPCDGKVQATMDNNVIETVVASFQNSKSEELLAMVKKIIPADEYLINPAGVWTSGGFSADSGLSGRKIVVDAYGPNVEVGGGSFSGKDSTKVDRSGAYMARKIAVDYIKKFSASEVTVKLAYAIGKSQPVMAVAIVDGKEKKVEGYDLTPKGIYDFLALGSQNFSQTCQWGHFGRGFSWDR